MLSQSLSEGSELPTVSHEDVLPGQSSGTYSDNTGGNRLLHNVDDLGSSTVTVTTEQMQDPVDKQAEEEVLSETLGHEQMQRLRSQIDGLLQMTIDHPMTVSQIFTKFFDPRDNLICAFKEALLSIDYERLWMNAKKTGSTGDVSYYATLSREDKAVLRGVIEDVLFGDGSLYQAIVEGEERG
jgi:hypothetical protein